MAGAAGTSSARGRLPEDRIDRTTSFKQTRLQRRAQWVIVVQAETASARYKWYVVFLLLLVYILSYFDRFILSLVIEPIKQAMGLSDFQVGLLLGPAFSLFNMIVIVPLGWYADRTSRKWMMILGILCWCSMTSAVAFVITFLPLLFFRLGVGLGEAVALPCSISIISDYFDRTRRTRPISVYMAGTYLGAGLAFLIGGNLVGWLQSVGHFNFLGFGPFEPWQAAFLLVGLPGIAFALMMLTVREPVRTETLVSDARGASLTTTLAYIRGRWKGFLVLVCGSACNVAISMMALWNVPLFQRLWHWHVAEIGTFTGIYFLIAGPAGTMLAVWGTRHLGRRRNDGAMRTLFAGLLTSVPASVLYPIMPTPVLAIVAMFIAFVGISIATACGPAALSLITPGEMRSQTFAMYTSVVTLLGPLFAPPLIGFAIDQVGNPRAIGVVLSGSALVMGVPTLIILALGLAHYRRAATEMDELAVPRPEPA